MSGFLRSSSARLAAALFIPLAAFVVQWLFWDAIRPYVWLLFFPAVFFSSRVGGLLGGLLATLLSAARVKPSRRMDGMSLLAFLSGWKPPVEQTFVWRDNWHDQKALRWGHWKWLKIQGEEYLFNLEEDPGEQENRKERNIDNVYWLRDIYQQWESAMPHNQTIFGDELRNLGAGNSK